MLCSQSIYVEKHEYTLLTAKINEEGGRRKKKASLIKILADDSSV